MGCSGSIHPKSMRRDSSINDIGWYSRRILKQTNKSELETNKLYICIEMFFSWKHSLPWTIKITPDPAKRRFCCMLQSTYSMSSLKNIRICNDK